MVLASVDDGFSTLFGIFLLLHLLAVIVAFAPAFVSPFLSARSKKEGHPLEPAIAGKLAQNTQQVHGPALVLAGIFGFAMIGTSKQAFKFSQAWVSGAMAIWIVMIGIVFGLIGPAERKLAAGDTDAEKKLSMFGGIMHLLLLVVLILMVFKPGFPS
jgi:uncharacterized membrane protein